MKIPEITDTSNIEEALELMKALPATRAAEFQAHMLLEASRKLDSETWKAMMIASHAFARRDRWIG